MFNVQIMIIVMLLPFIIGGIAYGIWPRKTKNLLMGLVPAWKKRYVICHLNYKAGLKDVFKVIPNQEGLTQVGKFSYNLSDKYAALEFNKRLHFNLDEDNAFPRTYIKQTDEDLVYRAAEIQTALNNTVMDYLFSKKKELLIMGLFIVAIIAIGAIIYNVYELNGIKAAIEASNQVVRIP
jgi:hypothetical protein